MLGRRTGLRLEHEEFAGSLSAIKRMCARIKKAKGVDPNDVPIPVDTAPGQVAQVDFGSVGKLWDPVTGKRRKAYVFVMVLGFSRHMFVRIVFDQKVDTWLALHVEAFAVLGGVPAVIVPDKLGAISSGELTAISSGGLQTGHPISSGELASDHITRAVTTDRHHGRSSLAAALVFILTPAASIPAGWSRTKNPESSPRS